MTTDGAAREPVELVVAAEEEGERLDVFLARHFLEFSRTHLRRAIAAGGVQVDGRTRKVAYRLCRDQRVRVQLPEPPREAPIPEDIPLEVLYEDEALVAVNKPPRMVVHPARGHWSGTLTAALAFHFQNLSSTAGATRPGIVHRLDRDTSGIIVVAKSDPVHHALSEQFAARTVEKEYFAIVAGRLDRDRDRINQPVGVHPRQREKMAIRSGHATTRTAETFYEVRERFAGFATLRVVPKTGRTHQIRVHLAHVGCPVLCDPLYGGRSLIRKSELTARGTGPAERASDEKDEVVLDRCALHAKRLSIDHPTSGKRLDLIAPVPTDLVRVVELLRGGADL